MATPGIGGKIAHSILRLSGMAHEHNELLMPISGYESMSLVTLEEAVQLLVSLLPAVQSYVYVAKQKSKIPAENLTQNESASIMLYSIEWEPLDQCLYIS
ncbi:unnamed protein product [Rotaria sp. Silwood1]|nr:unnamed protein product [Rotaria sp. Silwood1]